VSDQRTIVITGANTGIGLETAVALASMGDRVVIACRNQTKAASALDTIRTRAVGAEVDSVPLDLSSFASIRSAASTLGELTPRIDVLINNAGGILSNRSTTAEGFETQFGVNHLGHFLLTTLLEDQIKSAPSPRVINVSSLAHWGAIGGLRWNDLQSTKHYSGWVTYFRSKLANILFTRELAARWASDGVVTHALHPGSVGSDFGQTGDMTGLNGLLMKAAPLVSITPAVGALTSIFLATSPTALATNGGYWAKSKPARTAPWAKDDIAARKLWMVSSAFIADGHP